MADKILFVDDEAELLKGYQIMLRQNFEVDTATGGQEGLLAIRERGPYAVVVSDMRMPEMNGAEFLSRVRRSAPDTTRMMLTGHTDIKIAVDAVNEGNIFRFLTKPCEKTVLTEAIQAAVVQHRLLTAEKELLENTLMGSIKALTDVLAAISPQALGRSVRITRCVRHLVKKFRLAPSWCFEASAMLSQLGCITLEPEVTRAAYFGARLAPAEQGQFEAHPHVAADLLTSIPRMEPVAWMIRHQLTKDIPHSAPHTSTLPKEVVVFGAKMLRVAVAFDNLKLRGLSNDEAIDHLRQRSAEFEKEIVDMMTDIKTEDVRTELRRVAIASLTVGMVLQEDVKNRAGLLVVAKGQEVTRPLLARLDNFSRGQLPLSDILASVPVYDEASFAPKP